MPKKHKVHDVTWKQSVPAYLFLIPWFLGILCFQLVPLVSSLYYSFTSFNLFGDAQLAGLDNYRYMFTADTHYWSSVKATLIYVFLGVPLQLAFALLLALLLNKNMRALPIFRAIYYIPSLLGASVAISMLWRQFFDSKGMFNRLLQAVGVTGLGEFPWISNPDTAIYMLVLLLVWQFGSPMLIFLAGLKQVPAELTEAAEIDGARRMQVFRYITLPMLSPILFFNLVMQIISAFKAFTPAFIVSNGTGGALDSVLFYTLHIYRTAFVSFRMGYASALGWILILLIAVFTAILFKTSRWVYYNE